MIKKALLSLVSGLLLGLLVPVTVQALVPTGPDFGFGSRTASTHERTEDTVEVDPVVTPSTNREENSCALVTHAHWHTNISENTSEQYFRAAVYATAISLEDDFMDDIDTTDMVCSNGNGIYVDCSFDKTTTALGTEIYDSNEDSSNTDEWNGTTITYETLDWVAGNPAGLVWRYGQDDPTDITLLPWINPGEGKGEAIMFIPEDFTQENTATTKSWTKLEFFWIDPDVYDDGDGSYSLDDFTQVYPDYVSSDGETDDIGVDPDGDFIFWYGINGIEQTHWDICEEPPLTCADLSLSPTSFSVSDVFNDVNLSLTATNSDGDDITNDVTYTYYANKYGTSSDTAADADGTFFKSLLKRGNELETRDPTIEYRNSEPGDRLYIAVSDYEGVDYTGTGTCDVELEFPYCTDLDITDPSGFAFIASGAVDMPIEFEAEANNGEEWPYSVDYNSTDAAATFDGTVSTYTTTDKTVDSYQSSDAASVWVELDDENGDGESDDVAGVCSDSFSYGMTPTCDYLEITIPTDTLTCEEMTAGDVQITWVSFMSSGAPSTGPWLVTSSNSAGTFSLTSGGATAGTGGIVSTVSTLYYSGGDGDTIQVMDLSYPVCVDTLESESCEEVPGVCEDLSLSEPYIENADGSTTTIDLTSDADLETLYEETTVCWDYTLNTSDATYASRLIADGFTDITRSAHTGNLSLTMNETAGSTTGNPASLTFTGFETYTGTLCWENFEAGNLLGIFVLGDRLTCSDTEVLPPPAPEAPVCVDLQMDPDTFTMTATDADAGNIPVTIDVGGSDATWTGTLIVNRTGTGALFYTDGSPSEFSDGHLEIPVSGTATSVIVFYRNGLAGDVVTSYIEGEDTLCADNFTIAQTEADLICEDLTLNPDSVTMESDDEDAGTINGTVVVTGSDSEWTGMLIITKTGAGQLQYSNGSSSAESDGHLEVPVSGTSSTVTFTYVGGDADDTVTAYVETDPNLCFDTFTISQEESPDIVCEDIDFSEEEILVDANCQDSPAMEVCIDRDSDDERTIEICYENQDGDDGEFTFEGKTYEGCEEITVEFGPGETSQCLDIQFSEVCEDADITVSEGGEICEDLAVEEVEMGTFNKFIYTFNFSTDKNAYKDDGVFFSHDEDRAFYTLQYEPTGDEEAITFTDEMWGSDLEGKKGDGSDSEGTVSLAESYTELTKGKSGTYDYESIENFGFGTHPYATDSSGDPLLLEENSGDIADYIEATFSEGNFMTFIPYIKMSGAESVLIPECEYDGDELSTETVCYDPEYTPEDDEKVVIENAGTVYETYGASAAIRIRYVGVIDSRLNCDDTGDECLTEEFENSASVEVYENLDALTASARLVVLCSYLMTQNAGDVYLEIALEAGSDISCIFVEEGEATSSDYRNVDALVILEGDDITPSSTVSDSTISWCDDSDENLIGNLSSYVCEIVAKVTELWAKTTVESTTESHVDQAIRNAETNQSSGNGDYANWSALTTALTNKNNPDSNILYFAGDPDSDTDTVTLGELTVPAGAWTVIVEDADLILNGNIAYATVSNPGDYKNLPSIAFVVQGGDIYFNDNALRAVGVFYTDQKFDGDERSAVDEQLTIDGSLYGNVQTLIERAKYVGPPTVDGGGIVIRYDSRILLNTPPGLSEYVDINTEKGVN